MPNDNQRKIDEIRDALEARLHVLQVQQASLGLETPPHITTEIESIERRLGEWTVAAKVLNGGAVSEEVLRILRQLAPGDLVIKTQMMQQMELRDLRTELERGLEQRRVETTEKIDEVRDEVGALRTDLGTVGRNVAGLRMAVLALVIAILVGGCATWGMLIYLLTQR
jgi:hypothetical protein